MTVHSIRRKLTVADLERMNVAEALYSVKAQECPASVRDVLRNFKENLVAHVEKGEGLVLTGPPGVGKSGMAVVLLKEARAVGFTGYFAPVWELRECVRNKIMFEGEMTVHDRCVQVDVLVLDGLVAADATEHVFGAKGITELLMTRAQRKRTTILTTQLSYPKLKESFSALLTATKGCMVLVPVEGEDRREHQAQELEKSILGTG